MKKWLYSLIACGLFLSCRETAVRQDHDVKLSGPSWFPEAHFPKDNTPTEARIELGRRLFYDTRLSDDGGVSCASCHTQSSAFTDGKKTSVGAHGKVGKRNAPSLQNLIWMPYFMMEGGVPTLEMQVLAPVQDSMEMRGSIVEKAKLLAGDVTLNNLSRLAYNRDLDVYVITRALACFERSLISADSKFDRYYYMKNESAFSELEKKGMEIFFSTETMCSSCHSGPMLSDFQFHNVGLYEHYADPGKERETYAPQDSGKFKTPSLRNIALTAPYMHDGSLNTLEEVVDFFVSGGQSHYAKDARVTPLKLSQEDKKALIAFLNTLTDWTFVQNPKFLPLEQ